MNVCSHGFIYLFRSTTSRQAEEEPSFCVNSHETRGRGVEGTGDKKETGGTKGRDRGGACLGKTVTLLQSLGAQQRQTWPIPHLELVKRNLSPALTSETHSGKKEEEGVVAQEILSPPSSCQTQVCV